MNHPATGYRITENGRSITCLSCGLTSHNVEDVRQRFCGRCHVFHEDENFHQRLRGQALVLGREKEIPR